MKARPSRKNEFSCATLIRLENLYNCELLGFAKSPIKPRTKKIIPTIKAGLIFLSGVSIQATGTITTKTVKEEADC